MYMPVLSYLGRYKSPLILTLWRHHEGKWEGRLYTTTIAFRPATTSLHLCNSRAHFDIKIKLYPSGQIFFRNHLKVNCSASAASAHLQLTNFHWSVATLYNLVILECFLMFQLLLLMLWTWNLLRKSPWQINLCDVVTLFFRLYKTRKFMLVKLPGHRT